jgi:anti-anti-sigma factor
MTFTQQVRAGDAGLVVSLGGEMDLTVTDRFERDISRLIADESPAVLHLDLSGLRFLDSSGVSALVRVWRTARRQRCAVRVVNPTGVVRQILDVTGALAIVGATR